MCVCVSVIVMLIQNSKLFSFLSCFPGVLYSNVYDVKGASLLRHHYVVFPHRALLHMYFSNYEDTSSMLNKM